MAIGTGAHSLVLTCEKRSRARGEQREAGSPERLQSRQRLQPLVSSDERAPQFEGRGGDELVSRIKALGGSLQLSGTPANLRSNGLNEHARLSKQLAHHPVGRIRQLDATA